MWHAQEHFNSCTQLLVNLELPHILTGVRLCLFYGILCGFFCLSFFMRLSCDTSDSMLGKIQGLLKTVQWNSRTFQEVWQSRTFRGFTIKYKDFSRLREPWTILGCIPLGGSGSGFLIQDCSDHCVPKERNFGS